MDFLRSRREMAAITPCGNFGINANGDLELARACWVGARTGHQHSPGRHRCGDQCDAQYLTFHTVPRGRRLSTPKMVCSKSVTISTRRPSLGHGVSGKSPANKALECWPRRLEVERRTGTGADRSDHHAAGLLRLSSKHSPCYKTWPLCAPLNTWSSARRLGHISAASSTETGAYSPPAPAAGIFRDP